MKKEKIKLYGFNNLTKTLSFNIYDVCVTQTVEERQQYINYIDEMYNSTRLTSILTDVSNRIGASILNISKQDYEPQGASVTILISEEKVPLAVLDPSCNNGELPLPRHVVGHLDKSHLTVHSYPESHPEKGISTFRVDIEVSTCGDISPLNALDYLIDSFDSDIITIDYRVRGFTRDESGTKLFIDHPITSIQDFIRDDTINRYNLIDVNVYQEHIFHTKMMVKQLDINNYLFGKTVDDLTLREMRNIEKALELEMEEIFYGQNFK